MKLYIEIDEGKNHQFWQVNFLTFIFWKCFLKTIIFWALHILQDMLTVTQNEVKKLKKMNPQQGIIYSAV